LIGKGAIASVAIPYYDLASKRPDSRGIVSLVPRYNGFRRLRQVFDGQLNNIVRFRISHSGFTMFRALEVTTAVHVRTAYSFHAGAEFWKTQK
jgi:hypothetical protein